MMLNNNVVIITGGAGLLGREFVRAVLLHGGTPVVADKNIDAARAAADALNAETDTHRALAVALDITSRDSIREMTALLHERYGRIDAVVNNAYPRNSNYGRHFFDVEYSDFCENLGLNLGGYFLVSQQLAAYFRTQGYGNIVNISSIYGVIAPRFDVYEGLPMTMPVEYAAIKAGLLHLTRYMAAYFKGMNIRVNAISPGGILDRQPAEFLARYGEYCSNKGMLAPADLAGTLVYLLSDLSAYVNGQNIVVDDGFTL